MLYPLNLFSRFLQVQRLRSAELCTICSWLSAHASPWLLSGISADIAPSPSGLVFTLRGPCIRSSLIYLFTIYSLINSHQMLICQLCSVENALTCLRDSESISWLTEKLMISRNNLLKITFDNYWFPPNIWLLKLMLVPQLHFSSGQKSIFVQSRNHTGLYHKIPK